MITFTDVFNTTITDNNGVTVTDINQGLHSSYNKMIDSITHNTQEASPCLIIDEDQHQPDLLAYKYYNSMDYWYWFLFSNFIEDPFEEIESGYVVHAYTEGTAEASAESKITITEEESRIGVVLTLN